MAEFLNTSAITYHLENLMKQASERLILISPYLKFNERVREILEDKDRMKIDVRLVYGKSELQPDEHNWLKSLKFIRCSYCKNLHAKCYLNEASAIITSMNLYEFSQVNNNEMGILIQRDQDSALYADAYNEAQRLIRISEEVKISIEKVSPKEERDEKEKKNYISTSKLAKKLGCPSKEMFSKLLDLGWIERKNDAWHLTRKGVDAGGQMRKTKQYGEFIVWPENLVLDS